MFLDRLKKLSRYREHVYTDEQILPGRAKEPAADGNLPAPLRSVRAMEETLSTFRQSREQIFYKQAKLLERYEDDKPYPREVVRFYPTYQSLNNEELRGYFTWRTQLRAGNVEKTSLSFAMLYMYELLNQIGCSDPLDGYHKLASFRDAYSRLDDRILKYLDTWLRDYIIYYNLDHALLPPSSEKPVDQALLVLLNLDAYTDEQIVDALVTVSGYSLERSRFYKERKKEMTSVISRVLKGIRLHYRESCQKEWTEDYFGTTMTIPVRLFPSAVFHEQRTNVSFDYPIDPLRVYHNRNGRWTFTGFDTSRLEKHKAAALIRTVDSVMRDAYGFKYPMKPGMELKWLLTLIRQETARLQEEERQANRKVLHLDYSVLEKIREDAAYTRDRLITEEEAEPARLGDTEAAVLRTDADKASADLRTDTDKAPVDLISESSSTYPVHALVSESHPEKELPEVPPNINEADSEQTRLDSLLTEHELHYLRSLLDKSDLSWLRGQGLMASVLTDSINDKLYDLFEDTVLDEDGIIPDYIEDLKEMLS